MLGEGAVDRGGGGENAARNGWLVGWLVGGMEGERETGNHWNG